MPANPSVDPAPGHCFNCWQPGHLHGNCPFKRRHLFCYNCGRRFRNLNTCERCGEAHEEFMARRAALSSLPDRSGLQGQERNTSSSSRVETSSVKIPQSRPHLPGRNERREVRQQRTNGNLNRKSEKNRESRDVYVGSGARSQVPTESTINRESIANRESTVNSKVGRQGSQDNCQQVESQHHTQSGHSGQYLPLATINQPIVSSSGMANLLRLPAASGGI